jgi:hypothetical protein
MEYRPRGNVSSISRAIYHQSGEESGGSFENIDTYTPFGACPVLASMTAILLAKSKCNNSTKQLPSRWSSLTPFSNEGP